MNKNEKKGIVFLISNLEIIEVFKDEDKKKGGKYYGLY